MAEPARRLGDEPERKQVYDTSGTAPSDPRSRLKSLEGGGESSEPRRGHIKSADDSPEQDDLSEREEDPDAGVEGQLGKGYTQSRIASGNFITRNLNSRRNKWIAGLLGLGGVGTIVFTLFFLPALRLESYLSQINDRVFSTASNAVQQRVEHLFEGYMSSYVLSLDKCGGTISPGCRANYSGSIASSLYKSWQDAKIEQTLFDKYHFELISLKNPSAADGAAKYTLRDPFGHRVTLTNGDLRRGNFTGGSREIGNEVNKFLRENTRWYDVMQRRSVRKYLVRKHGVKFWCFFACKQKDSIDLKIADAKTRFKYKLIQRIIYPFSPKLGAIMDCLLTDPSSKKCTPEQLRERGLDSSIMSDEELQNLIEDLAKNPNQSLTQVMLNRLIDKIISDEVANQTAKRGVSAIPVAGEVYLALSVIDMLNTADKCLENYCLSNYAADINSSQYLEYYSAMRSANDEMKTGVLPADDVGALVSQFNDGNMPAEQSMVYKAYTNTGNNNKVALGDAIVLAAATNYPNSTPSYKCANGQPIPKGELVCPEKKVARTYKIEDIRNNNIVDGLDNILNVYQGCPTFTVGGTCVGLRPVTVIHPLLKGINNISSIILSPIINGFIEGIKNLPGVGDVVTYAQKELGNLINYFMTQLFPLPVQPDSPGRDKYDGLEAGGEVAASEFNQGGYTLDGQQYGLGGRSLSTQEQVDATTAYLQQEQYYNDHINLISRVTSLANPDSLGSRFIAAMPVSFLQFRDDIFSFITNPFHSISLSKPAFAATNTAAINAFGIPRFGYTANDPAFTANPSLYTPEYCQQLQQKWEASKTQDPVTGIDEYSATNPCLLEQVSVEAASSIFTGNDSLND